VFNNAPEKAVVERISEKASASDRWVESRTTSGIRWTNEKEGIQLRISDDHGEVRLYASRYGPRAPAPFAILRR